MVLADFRPQILTLAALGLVSLLGTLIGLERQLATKLGWPQDNVELAAILVPTTADPNELDAVIAALKRSPMINSATWTVGTTA
jgi:hypothetical protein